MSSVVENLRLEQIDFDLDMQSRVKMDESVISEYAEAITEGAKFPPVTVFRDSATHWLADGFHRYFAHKKIGALDIQAEIIVGTRRDAILHSLGANANHGLRRTDADKRRAILRMLEDEEWGRWSNREIARRCGVHPTTVSRVKEDVAAFYRGEARDEGGKYRPGREVVFNSNAVMNIPTVHVDSEPRTYTTKHGTEAVMSTANIGKKKEQAPKQPESSLPDDSSLSSAQDGDDDNLGDESLADIVDELQKENEHLYVRIKALTADDTGAQLEREIRTRQGIEARLAQEMDRANRLDSELRGYGKWMAELRKLLRVDGGRREITAVIRNLVQGAQ